MSGKKTKKDAEYYKKLLKKSQSASYLQLEGMLKNIIFYERIMIALCKKSITGTVVITQDDIATILPGEEIRRKFEENNIVFDVVIKGKFETMPGDAK